MNEQNEQNDHKPTIKDKILSAIRSKEINQKPRAYFLTRNLLVIAGLVFSFLTLVFLISFTLFSLGVSGAWFLPVFGFRGWRILLTSLPWFIIGLSIILIIITEGLAKNYAPIYKKPILVSVIVIIVFALLSSFALYATPMHQRLFTYTRERSTFLVQPFYHQYGMMRPDDFTPGVITLFIGNDFRILTPINESLLVITNSQTLYPRGQELLIGDWIIVIGEKEDGTIVAEGIRKIRQERNFWFPMPGPRH